MFSTYRAVLGLPGALAFSASGLLARAEMAMVEFGTVLLVQHEIGSYAVAGALAGTIGLAAAAAGPFVARFVDRVGQAGVLRPVAAVHAVALLGFVAVVMGHLPLPYAFVGAAVVGASMLSIGALVRARWAALVAGTDRMQTAFALESTLDEVTFIVGPVLVTVLAALVHPAIALIVAALTAVSGAWVLAAQHRTQPAVSPRHARADRAPGLLRVPGLLVVVVVFLAAGGIFGSAEVTVAATAKAAGVPAVSGVILALWAIGSFTAGLAYGAVRWRGRPERRFVAIVVLLAVLTVPMLLAPNLVVLGIVFLAAGFAIAPAMTTGSTMVELLVPAGRLTEGLAWTTTALNITYATSAAVAGVVIDAHGARAGFLVPVTCASVAAIAAVIGARWLHPGSHAASAVAAESLP